MLFHRLVLAVIVVLGLIVGISGLVVSGAQPTPAATAAAPKDGLAKIRLGSVVRVKCTSLGVELNNARLVAVTDTTVTVDSTKGDRYTLPRETTVVEAPVNWTRTVASANPRPRNSRSGLGGWGWGLLLLAIAGVGALVLLRKGRHGQSELGETGARIGTTVRVGKKARVQAGSRFVLSSPAFTGPAAAPAAPPAARPAEPESNSDPIEQLIEEHAYGSAIELLEQQIKIAPNDFKLRLQLLKAYIAIENRKQADRVLLNIISHPTFAEEQKQQARHTVETAYPQEHASTASSAEQKQAHVPVPAAKEKSSATPSVALAEVLEKFKADQKKEARPATPAAKETAPAAALASSAESTAEQPEVRQAASPAKRKKRVVRKRATPSGTPAPDPASGSAMGHAC